MRTFRCSVIIYTPSSDKFISSNIGGMTLAQAKKKFLTDYKATEKRHHAGEVVINCLTNHSFTFTDKKSGQQLFIYYQDEAKTPRVKFLVKDGNRDYLALTRQRLSQGKATAKTKARRFQSNFQND